MKEGWSAFQVVRNANIQMQAAEKTHDVDAESLAQTTERAWFPVGPRNRVCRGRAAPASCASRLHSDVLSPRGATTCSAPATQVTTCLLDLGQTKDCASGPPDTTTYVFKAQLRALFRAAFGRAPSVDRASPGAGHSPS